MLTGMVLRRVRKVCFTGGFCRQQDDHYGMHEIYGVGEMNGDGDTAQKVPTAKSEGKLAFFLRFFSLPTALAASKLIVVPPLPGVRDSCFREFVSCKVCLR